MLPFQHCDGLIDKSLLFCCIASNAYQTIISYSTNHTGWNITTNENSILICCKIVSYRWIFHCKKAKSIVNSFPDQSPDQYKNTRETKTGCDKFRSTVIDRRFWCKYKYCFSVQDPRGKLHSPDSKVHGANMGPTWVLSAPDGPHVGPMKFAFRRLLLLPGITWDCGMDK